MTARIVFAGFLLSVFGVFALEGGLKTGAAAAEPPVTPFLRVETGVHTATINRLSTDAAGRILATASDDKTIRLWNAADGAAITVLRVPIDVGGVGALYAVALSPDGRSLVASGDTGRWDGPPVLYLFDVEKQTLRGRLPLPNLINHLAYSPDGRYFAAGFGGTAGLRVWDARTGKQVAEDNRYGDRVTWVAFDRSGRIATASYDGNVRLYDNAFALIAKQKAPSGRQPFSVAFSPDGALLAVGYADQPKVDVLSGADLSKRFAPDTRDLRQGNLAAVAWTADNGAVQLLAGGMATDRNGWMIIRRWNDLGMGPPLDIPAARDSINQIEPMPGGGAIFASADPAWGRLEAGGRLAIYRGGGIGDFRDISSGRFAISNDGLTIDFGMTKGGRDPFRFDFRSRRFDRNPAADPALAGPIEKSRNLTVTDWKNSNAPKLGKRALPLDPAERSLSLAITPDGRGFLLGTDFYLRYYDARGTEIRRVAVPGAAWGVVVAGNGTVAAAALGDGTLHWYSLVPGQELEERVTLFPDPDGKRWVASMPEAFFDHSDLGGKELVGFLLNQGKTRSPTWIDFSQVYRLYYAPELVIPKLTGAGIGEIQSRLARIGDVRAQLERRPLPTIELTEYCLPETRGFARVFEPPTGAGPTAPPAAPPSTGRATAGDATQKPGPVAVTGKERCAPIDLTQGARGGTRSLQVIAAPTRPAAGPAGPVAPATESSNNAAAFAAELPTGTSSIKLRFKVVDRGGGIGAIDVFLNDRNVGRDGTRGFGRPATADTSQTARQLTPIPAVPSGPGTPPAPLPAPLPADVIERTIPLDAGINRIVVRAFESSNSVFERAPLIELTAPAAKQPVAQEPSKPRLFVLSAGVNRYTGTGVPPLRFAVADAQSFVASIRKHSSTLFGELVVTELYDEQATLPNVEAALVKLSEQAQSQDTALIYLSGHGINDLPSFGIDRYYFVTQNVSSVQTLTKEALSENRLIELVSTVRAKNSFLFLDTCHAGALTNNDAAKIGNDVGRFVLAASASVQEALDSYDGHNGLMAYALMNGLSGQADATRDGVITNFNLGFYVQNQVQNLAKTKQWDQRAVFKISSDGAQPFPMAKVQ